MPLPDDRRPTMGAARNPDAIVSTGNALKTASDERMLAQRFAMEMARLQRDNEELRAALSRVATGVPLCCHDMKGFRALLSQETRP